MSMNCWVVISECWAWVTASTGVRSIGAGCHRARPGTRPNPLVRDCRRHDSGKRGPVAAADREVRMSDDLRGGLRVSQFSIIWTVVTSSAAITLGITTPSLVLVAFGLTGLLDAAGSIALVAHFRHALRHEVVSEKHEHVALQIVGTGLVVTGAATAVESVRRLVTHHEGHGSGAGAVIAAASVVVLAILAARKRRIARVVGSDALRADGLLSATGALLA